MELVVARGLCKTFGSVTAVDDVGISVPAGEVHGLLGPNGAGKTTLLRMLFGLVAPDAGEIELTGRRLAGPGSAALDQVGGFVEDPSFYPYLSAAANLSLLARLDGGDHSRGRSLDVLSRVGLRARADDRVGGFSTGMRQRLGVAAALLREPRVLLLDEPTSGLDPAGSRDAAALMRELADQGVAVLISSHRIGELERICDAYTFLHDGRIGWQGSANALALVAPASAYEMQTSDDALATSVAERMRSVRVGAPMHGPITIAADLQALDELVLELAAARVSVRRLELRTSPLESMFFALSDGQSVADLDPDDLVRRASAEAGV